MPSNIERCYQCGQCTSVCPMGEQEQAYKIRRLLQREKLGLESEEILTNPSIFYCTTCYRCQDNCPQGVNIVDGILEIRARAVHNGSMLAPHKKVGQILSNYGYSVSNNDNNKEKRIKLDLDATPTTLLRSAEQINEIKTLLQLTGFDQLITEEKSEENLNEEMVLVQSTEPSPVPAEEQL